VALSRGARLVFGLLILAVLVSAGGMALLFLGVSGEPEVQGGSTLVLRPGGELAETAPDDVFQIVSGEPTQTVRTFVEALARAKADRRITGVLLMPRGLDSPYWGKVQELRDAVLDFRRSGKPVVALLEYGGQHDYYLATAADRVLLVPSAPLALTGVALYEVFLRGTLDWIGTFPDLLHIGDYKTAVNTFTEKTFTPAHKEMSEALAGDQFAQLVRGVAEGRKKPEAEVRALIDRGPFTAEEALGAGLVDALGYDDQLDDLVPALRAATGEDIRRIELETYARVSDRAAGIARGSKIAVIYAAGTIVSGRSRFDPVNGPVVGSDTLVEHIREARADRSVKAVVLRIDSPGGSSVASDVIWRELSLLKEGEGKRPLVVSMSDLAASGGYYLAMAGDAIVAQPGTLTGSIGIFTGKYVIGGTLEQLHANIESTSEGRHAEIYSPARPFTDEERANVMASMQTFYDEFVERAAAARHTTPEKIDAVAQGRVWTGAQAREHGLVDRLGGLDTAVSIAKQRAGIPAEEEVQRVVFPPKRPWYEVVSRQLQGPRGSTPLGAAADTLAPGLGANARRALGTLVAPARLFRSGEILALMPYTFLAR
jgi:protease-4